jgi:translation elongation factor EF-Tu-like GTPase
MRARLQLLAADQGGRHTPIFDDYRPRFVAATDGHGDVDLGVAVVKLTENPMMMPGTEGDVDLEPVDASLWTTVATGLILGVFEEQRQVGTATVLGP